MDAIISTARQSRSWMQARGRLDGDHGANLVEYAMLLAFIVVICIVAVQFVGSATCENMDDVRLSAFGEGGGESC